ncbi:NUDIX domain-containing protein [Nocardiopsis flavescens]|uniref:NUDIX hydrolase n=1 Tax=Nocardiopsis flavescens TaxID=758803 RepID=UPI003665B31F
MTRAEEGLVEEERVEGPVIDLCVVLFRGDGRVLLGERQNTGFQDGRYAIPGGGLEPGESVAQGAARELFEEVGVTVDPDTLHCAHVTHHRSARGATRIGFFFTAPRWEGTPVNREPHLCSRLTWEDPDDLPENTIPFAADVIARIRRGEPFSAHGWD